jgi:hypothetical protein
MRIDRLDHLVLTVAELERHGVPIEEGPVAGTGATGVMESVYMRGPDGNLVGAGGLPGLTCGHPGYAGQTGARRSRNAATPSRA